jgi:preprotein translocase subunit YajC
MLISLAHAAEPAASQQGGLMGLLPLIIIFVLFWFMLIRPQMKRAKEQKAMLEALQKGDEVLTAGGVAGKVVKVSENYVTLELGENNNVLVQKQAITVLLPKGTMKESS